jgi:N-acetyl-gamma-glutamylphosphate reductase
MTHTIFIDGEAGTTGLEIRERLEARSDLELILLGDRRRDVEARREALNSADAVILCLPDDAAKEAVAMIDNPSGAGDRRLNGVPGRSGLDLWLRRDGPCAGSDDAG